MANLRSFVPGTYDFTEDCWWLTSNVEWFEGLNNSIQSFNFVFDSHIWKHCPQFLRICFLGSDMFFDAVSVLDGLLISKRWLWKKEYPKFNV